MIRCIAPAKDGSKGVRPSWPSGKSSGLTKYQQVRDCDWVKMDKMEETRTRTEAAVSNVVSLTARRA